MSHRHDYWRVRLNQVSPYWPRRLLHLQGDKLVSVERVGASTYGAVESPTYNILSYTWGRYIIPSGGSPLIENVSWPILCVDPEHFNTGAILSIIKRVALGCEDDIAGSCQHIWLDIACINQLDQDEMLDEIGHQAAIFNRAKHCFLWMNHTSASSVVWILKLWSAWASRTLWASIEGPAGPQVISRWPAKHRDFFSDPWFSSLWTLQEAFLRPDAILLTQENSEVRERWRHQVRGEDKVVRLHNLTGACTLFCEALEGILDEDDPSPIHRKIYQEVLELIDEFGLRVMSLGNTIKLYACSDNKKPRDVLDKIYGIQQIFGISLGRASSLSELEDRLGAALNELNPVIAQAFIHTEEASPSRSWRLTPKIHVPWNVLYILEDPQPSCEIRFDEGLATATFSGLTASFEDCVRFWKVASENEDYNGSLDCVETIHLDRTPSNRARFSPLFFESETFPDEWTGLNMNAALRNAFGPELCVLLLGRTTYTNKQWKHKSIGMIAYPSQDGSNAPRWLRVGFVIWDVWSDEEAGMEEQLFEAWTHPLHLG